MRMLNPIIRIQENGGGPSGARPVDPQGRRAAAGGGRMPDVQTREADASALPPVDGMTFMRTFERLSSEPLRRTAGGAPAGDRASFEDLQQRIEATGNILHRTAAMGDVLHRTILAVRNNPAGRTYSTYDAGRRELARMLGGKAPGHLLELAGLDAECPGAPGEMACILAAGAIEAGLEREVGVREAMQKLLEMKRPAPMEAVIRELVIRTCVLGADRELAREMGGALLKLGEAGFAAGRRLAGPHEGGQDSMGLPRIYRRAMMELMEK